MLQRFLIVVTIAVLAATPASAQFYKDKTLTLLVNYAAGGNADTEARVYQRHLAKHIPGRPNVIIRNVAGAGGATTSGALRAIVRFGVGTTLGGGGGATSAETGAATTGPACGELTVK